ncbi:MAG: TetR/AcrR family transcriptional regulator [Actinomycetota bacterium]
MAKRAEYLGPEKRRPLVLDAAERIFGEGGFADASMQAIADRAEISKAVLYDCFPGGKQEIYYAMLERLGERFEDRMLAALERSNQMPLRDGIRSFLEDFHAWADENPEGFKILFGAGGSADSEIVSHTQKARRHFIDKMSKRTKQIMEAAGLTFEPIHNLYNIAIIAMCEATARWRAHEPDLDKDLLIRMTTAWMMRGFEGVAPGTSWQEHVNL